MEEQVIRSGRSVILPSGAFFGNISGVVLNILIAVGCKSILTENRITKYKYKIYLTVSK